MQPPFNEALNEAAIIQNALQHLRIGNGLDFHSLYKGASLVLAGVPISYEAGFRVRRSDGDPVSHAIVDAILAALSEGDIADWFNDQDGTTNARSITYLGELRERLLEPRGIIITHVQAIILAEQPKLKPYFEAMRRSIAEQLAISPNQVSIQGKTFEGKGVIGTEQGVGSWVTVTLYEPGSKARC
jgi:2-C-methyl-D-erythritol 2,4-cyclodiphosphate synthase